MRRFLYLHGPSIEGLSDSFSIDLNIFTLAVQSADWPIRNTFQIELASLLPAGAESRYSRSRIPVVIMRTLAHIIIRICNDLQSVLRVAKAI